MSELQEVLAVLLGAESEARRIVDEAKMESEALKRTTKENFATERESRMGAVREQAKSMMENSLSAAQTEARQILELGKEERERAGKRFDENIDAVVASVLVETVDKLNSGGA